MSVKPLTVVFNTYPVAFDCPGGGEMQLLRCKEALEKLNVRVLLFNQWQPQFDEADIVHHFSVMPGSWNFCYHVKQRGLPLVISPIIWPRENRQMYAWDEIKRLLHLCDKALPNSQAEVDLLTDLFELPEGKCVPVVNGVDDIFFEPISPDLFFSTYGIKRPFVFCAGNIEPRKNQLSLIRACNQLKVQLVLAGNVRNAEYWQQCQQEAGADVHYIGHLEHGSELHRSAYAACSVFALPSTLETPGLAALEAAAAGCPIVITDEGSAKEYFDTLALYIRYDDVDALSQALAQALAHNENTALGVRIRQNYTWGHAAEQLIRVYRLLAGM